MSNSGRRYSHAERKWGCGAALQTTSMVLLSESRLRLCLHKLKDLTRWPNRPLMEEPLSLHHLSNAAFVHKNDFDLWGKRQRTQSKSRDAAGCNHWTSTRGNHRTQPQDTSTGPALDATTGRNHRMQPQKQTHHNHTWADWLIQQPVAPGANPTLTLTLNPTLTNPSSFPLVQSDAAAH